MPRKLILTRPEFAEFLNDPRKIREFERLFDTVNEHDEIIDSSGIEAGTALSTAELALGLIEGLRELVDLLSQAPRVEPTKDDDVSPPGVQVPQDDLLEPRSEVMPYEDLTPPVVPSEAAGDITPPVATVGADGDITPPVVPSEATGDITPPAAPQNGCCDDVAPLPQQTVIPDELWFAALAPPPVPAKRKRYGAFHSEINQTPAALGANGPMAFEVTDITRGVINNTLYFSVDTEGVYNIQFSAQLTASASSDVMIWLVINGTNVPWSNSLVNIQNSNDAKIAAWNWLVKLHVTDQVQIYWRSTTHLATLATFPAADGYPAVPSVILTVTECTGDTNNGGDS